MGNQWTINFINRSANMPIKFFIRFAQYSQQLIFHELTHINCDSDQAGSIRLTASPSISASQTLVVEWRGEDFGFFDSWANGQGALNEIQNPGTYTVSVTTPQGCLLYTTSVLIEDQAQPPFDINIHQLIFPPHVCWNGKIT